MLTLLPDRGDTQSPYYVETLEAFAEELAR
jgi:hypothetical protein